MIVTFLLVNPEDLKQKFSRFEIYIHAWSVGHERIMQFLKPCNGRSTHFRKLPK